MKTLHNKKREVKMSKCTISTEGMRNPVISFSLSKLCQTIITKTFVTHALASPNKNYKQ